ncbi:receptor-like cytoplasmic kinase 176 [Brachypodium distachyon]|uniref:Protein kinase domain-containing protein n=1 Tax=Brachypodium distachyon TaxID=15368 RepID=I1IJI4_BRADI|nr:receptor-like cytoplasmic kinase 176 [Brachypodium distachyon]XP_024311162.1 receptor-like cytoplasmic kinase 176 [Brachypodium distachyon]KQJ87357.1 hypothetical protein BRADI_4g10490v3 [Brachypodium distachyon]|eukprot:XP_014757949.1 receptor-like cytoplasmic kinase 176 [Brachypodium distachyon]
MALWTELGQAATVAQLVGADIGGLISMTIQAALTARQNKKECEQLARRVLMIAELLPHLQLEDPEAVRPLAGLGDTLRAAHELVVSCQGRSVAYKLVMSGRQADRFRDVQSRIDSYLILFPVISYIGITHQLNRIYNVLVPDDAPSGEPSPISLSSQLPYLQESPEVAADMMIPHGVKQFTLDEITVATNNFAIDGRIGTGGSGDVYKGRLHDGRVVAVKHLMADRSQNKADVFRMELAILYPLLHENIIRLFGMCMEGEERLVIYEHMANGALSDYLHGQPATAFDSSPVRTSWKTRVEVLLGAARGIKHLHCHVVPPVIHRDIKSSNILLDARWVAQVTDFGISVSWDTRQADRVHSVMGTYGYAAPEHFLEGHLSPASDVYSFGVVMLETLTGMLPILIDSKEELASFALPAIEAGNLRKVLDKRPALEPRHFKALELVARMVVRCLRLSSRDRPPISVVVANLEAALEIICSDPNSVSENKFKRFFFPKSTKSIHTRLRRPKRQPHTHTQQLPEAELQTRNSSSILGLDIYRNWEELRTRAVKT